MNTEHITDCPEEVTLARYVTGELEETAAETLGEHLQRCAACEGRVDQLVHNEDTLTKALRASGRDQVPDNPQLANWIAGAQQLQTRSATTKPHTSGRLPEGALGREVFVACLRKSGLIAPQEVNRLADESAAADGESLARELVARRKLTPFQARALLRGKWKGLVLGKYVVLERLGEGGMGSVFKARHKRLKRTVCLKTLHTAGRKSPEMVERFRREARTVAALNHPNFVIAHDADEADGIPFLVMEFIEGRDLARVVNDDGPLSVQKALWIVRQTAEALDYAHRQGMVHRDVKPHNLLLSPGRRSSQAEGDTATVSEMKTTPNGRRDHPETCGPAVKILDMGLARFDSLLGANPDATTHASMTAAGVVMGTVDYMSPEQALNSRHADARSDMYSLGCTLYFLLTGRAMFPGETLMEKLVAHREQPPPVLADARRGISPGVEAVFHRMVAKRPEERYASMSELVDDLQALQVGQRPKAQSEPGTRRRWKPRLAIGLAAVLVIAAALTAWFPRDRETDSNGDGTPSSHAAAKSIDKNPQAKTPPTGHPNTRLNGGPGRVLVVVPHAYFYEDHFTSVTAALKQRGMESVVASSKSGYAHPKHGRIAKVPVEMTLDEVQADDFDAVIFLGGNFWEFTHKGGKTWDDVKRVVNQTLTARRAVAAVDHAVGVLDDMEIRKDCSFQNKRGCQFAQPPGRQGFLATISGVKQTPQLMEVLFDDLLPRVENR